jgi:hypothetical protein
VTLRLASPTCPDILELLYLHHHFHLAHHALDRRRCWFLCWRLRRNRLAAPLILECAVGLKAHCFIEERQRGEPPHGLARNRAILWDLERMVSGKQRTVRT